MGSSITQSPTTPASTPAEKAATRITNAADNAAVQRGAVVQDIQTRGAAHQLKSTALIDIARTSGFVEEKAVAFLNTTIDGQVKDVVDRSGEGQTAIRQTHGGLTTYMLEQSAPHDPTTAPYVVSADIAGGLGNAFLAAKAGMDATVVETERPRAKIPSANVPGGGKPFPPRPTRSAPPATPAEPPVESAPAPSQSEGAEKPQATEQAAAAPEGTHEAQPAAGQPAEAKAAEAGQPAEVRKAEPPKA